jgi:hypothetical protein
MPEETHPLVNLTQEDVEAMLRRALWKTLALAVMACIVLLAATGWRDAGMLAAGAAISAASIYEWRRLAQFINSRLENYKNPGKGWSVAVFFVFRLALFAGVIYVSLKCLRGSAIALMAGLALAVLTVGWEVFRLLRD